MAGAGQILISLKRPAARWARGVALNWRRQATNWHPVLCLETISTLISRPIFGQPTMTLRSFFGRFPTFRTASYFWNQTEAVENNGPNRGSDLQLGNFCLNNSTVRVRHRKIFLDLFFVTSRILNYYCDF